MCDETPEPEYLDESDTILPEARPGHTIGNYRILQRVGEGGMGEVYEAEQEQPVRRRVALKIVKHGMDTRQVVARFDAERQALAVMNHHNIAAVFDAGATERGRPFFVMEFVKGEPITRYCDKYRLQTRDRLRLFVQVCEGVQHAHHKGIIHRDIKPSNVLVQVEGDEPVPKIIDFGVAKATETRRSEETARTELGQIIGTPEYMSPEQAELTLEDIDTRTDVYSLGVLLYELLVGRLPFDPGMLRRVGFDEFRRQVREDEPPRPSQRFTTLGDPARETAEKRRTDPASLVRRLRGDLDWITMKALEKDRIRRYGSPAELAADIVRHLDDQPVLARPPSAGYRMSKFVRRHTYGVATGAVLLVLLVVFAATMAIQARRIAEERDRANRQATAATQVTAVLTELFDLSDPGEALGSSITARELLDKGLGQVRGKLADQPRQLASALAVIGDKYRRLGVYDVSLPLLEEALELQRGALGADAPESLAAASDLAELLKDLGRYDEAESLFLDTLDDLRRVMGDDAPRTLDAMNDLAVVYQMQGRNDLAERQLVETLAARRRVLGDGSAETAESVNDLGVLYVEQGLFDRAEPLLVEAFDTRSRTLGSDDPDTLQSQNNLAYLFEKQGRYYNAGPLYIEVIEKQRRVLGPDHADTLTAMNNLATLYFAQERYDEAEELWVEWLAAQRRLKSDEHPRTLAIMANVGDLYTRLGRLDEAGPLLTEAVDGCRRVLPAGHYFIGVNLRKYGSYLIAVLRYRDAEAALLEADEIIVQSLGRDHGQTAKVAEALVRLYRAWGKEAQAARWSEPGKEKRP